jgi:hypothetical protein
MARSVTPPGGVLPTNPTDRKLGPLVQENPETFVTYGLFPKEAPDETMNEPDR